MYFVRYEPIKTRLREFAVDDREMMPYFLGYVVVNQIALLISWDFMGQNYWGKFSDISSILISICGLVYCYRRNGGAKGRDFLKKLTVLGWIFGIRFLAVFIPTMFLMLVLGESAGLTEDAGSPLETGYLVVAGLIFYLRLGHHIRDTVEISQFKPDSSP